MRTCMIAVLRSEDPHVPDVPADRAELASLENQRVEERDRVQQLLERLGLIRAAVVLLRDVEECAREVRLHALRRLVRDLDAVLQDRHRELVARHGGEPQPELLVRLGRLVAGGLEHLLELGQPETERWQFCRHTQSPVLRPFVMSDSAIGPLALAERDDAQLALEHGLALLLEEQQVVVHRRRRARG